MPKIKLFLDENISRTITAELINLGFDAVHAGDAGLHGATDKEIALYAKCDTYNKGH